MRLHLFLCASVALSVVFSCGKPDPEPEQKPNTNPPSKPEVVAVTSVTLNKAELTLDTGGSETLTATVAPQNATDKTVTWNTSNASVATVANGVVTAVSEGTANVIAKAGDKSATCKVTVNKGVVAVTSITLNKTTLSLTKGQSETLTATVLPEEATDKMVSWSSDNATIASVDQNGLVSALKSGKVTITAKAGEKSATCEVTVITPVESVSLSITSLELYEGQTCTLVATIYPSDADDKTVVWITSNSGVATVSDGVVTAVAKGEAIITANVGGKMDICEVKVKGKGNGDNEDINDGDPINW